MKTSDTFGENPAPKEIVWTKDGRYDASGIRVDAEPPPVPQAIKTVENVADNIILSKEQYESILKTLNQISLIAQSDDINYFLEKIRIVLA